MRLVWEIGIISSMASPAPCFKRLVDIAVLLYLDAVFIKHDSMPAQVDRIEDVLMAVAAGNILPVMAASAAICTIGNIHHTNGAEI